MGRKAGRKMGVCSLMNTEYFRKNGGKIDYGKSKKSKFNNYEDENKTDYAALEEQILDMMLDEID